MTTSVGDTIRMSRKGIEWTDVTDNIIRVLGGGWWCRMISEGCVNCYAAKLNMNAFFGGNMLAYTGEPPKLELQEELIASWERQTRPRKHFVSSMTDVFGDWVPFGWALIFLRGMWRAPKQTFQVLTKRPELAADYVNRWLKFDGLARVPANILIGTSVENQKWADARIRSLLKIPGRLFLSVEPMLEEIHFGRWFSNCECGHGHGFSSCPNYGGVAKRCHLCECTTHRPRIDWAIFGGESGSHARPCNVNWIRQGVRQCRQAGVAPFVKQLGANATFNPRLLGGPPIFHEVPRTLKDKKGGDMSEWEEDLQVRDFPNMEARA